MPTVSKLTLNDVVLLIVGLSLGWAIWYAITGAAQVDFNCGLLLGAAIAGFLAIRRARYVQKRGGRTMKEESNAETFLDPASGTYRFPFVVEDPTPGDKSLGRIEWVVEPIFSGARLVRLLVNAEQTRDARYVGKIFVIPCNAEALSARPMTQDSWFNGVWHVSWCREHLIIAMRSYPEDDHSVLVINAGSSITVDIHYE